MRLFQPLSAWARSALDLLPEALNSVWPLLRRHRQRLPEDIRSLSALLTTERRELVSGFSYWSNPGYISAYLYYFLPWNLVRLAGIIPGLPLADPENNETVACWWDAGSGPLTLPMALWLSRPKWHDRILKIWATDCSHMPLRIGLGLFRELGRLTQRPTWDIRTTKLRFTTLDRGLEILGKMEKEEKKPHLWLFSGANFLNEIVEKSKPGRTGGGILHHMANILFPTNLKSTVVRQTFFVEPGNRSGSSLVMTVRRAAREKGIPVLYPCTHQGRCPLLGGDTGKTWCHFGAENYDAPAWLRTLSQKSGLDKKKLYISSILLGQKGATDYSPAHGQARIISGPIFLPDLKLTARYACMKDRIILLEDGAGLDYGDIIEISSRDNYHDNNLKDKKHGLPILKLP